MDKRAGCGEQREGRLGACLTCHDREWHTIRRMGRAYDDCSRDLPHSAILLGEAMGSMRGLGGVESLRVVR